MSDKAAYHPNNMRRRFHELKAKKAAIEAQLAPLRAEYDAIAQSMHAALKSRSDAIKAIQQEHDLFEIDMEMSRLVRLLGGKTGKPE